MPEPPLIQVEASPTFNRNLRTLAKKYRNIQNDIQPIIEQLEQGELLGDLNTWGWLCSFQAESPKQQHSKR